MLHAQGLNIGIQLACSIYMDVVTLMSVR